jgi:hypothetical protein
VSRGHRAGSGREIAVAHNGDTIPPVNSPSTTSSAPKPATETSDLKHGAPTLVYVVALLDGLDTTPTGSDPSIQLDTAPAPETVTEGRLGYLYSLDPLDPTIPRRTPLDPPLSTHPSRPTRTTPLHGCPKRLGSPDSLAIRCNESYTSKPRTRCGWQHRVLKKNTTFGCGGSGMVADRDFNAARNVLLRYQKALPAHVAARVL